MYCVIKPHNITSSNTKAKMAQTTIDIPYLCKGMLVREWKKGFLAATALLEEKQKTAILPLYVNRSSGDQQWAYKAAEQPTIALALTQLEAQLDGEKSKLRQSSVENRLATHCDNQVLTQKIALEFTRFTRKF